MPLCRKLSLVACRQLPLRNLHLLFIAAAAVVVAVVVAAAGMVEELLPRRDERFGEAGDDGRRVFSQFPSGFADVGVFEYVDILVELNEWLKLL